MNDNEFERSIVRLHYKSTLSTIMDSFVNKLERIDYVMKKEKFIHNKTEAHFKTIAQMAIIDELETILEQERLVLQLMRTGQ